MVSMAFTFGMINISTQERLHAGYVSYLAFLSSLQLPYLGADRQKLNPVGVGAETDRRRKLAGGPKLLSL